MRRRGGGDAFYLVIILRTKARNNLFSSAGLLKPHRSNTAFKRLVNTEPMIKHAAKAFRNIDDAQLHPLK